MGVLAALRDRRPGGRRARRNRRVALRRPRRGDRRLTLVTLASVGVASPTASASFRARFVQGIGSSITWAGALSWLALATPSERRGRTMGTAIGAAVFGALLGPVIGAGASAIGVRAAFSIVAGVCVVLIALVFWFDPPPPERQPARCSPRRVPEQRVPPRALGDDPAGPAVRDADRASRPLRSTDTASPLPKSARSGSSQQESRARSTPCSAGSPTGSARWRRSGSRWRGRSSPRGPP